jgi:anti-sigma B factor antagonist
MKITVQEKESVTIVSLDGSIMQEDVAIMRSRLEDLIHSGKTRMILDLAGVTYLSSMCLAVIVSVKSQLVAKHGDLKLSSLNELIKNLFEMTQLVRKFPIYNTVEEAEASYRKN